MSDILKKIIKKQQPVKDDDFSDDHIAPQKSSVKLKNPNQTEKLPSIKDSVDRVLQDEDFKKQMAVELSTKLIAAFNSKILDENKSPIDKKNELNALAEFKEFCSTINIDKNEVEGNGSLLFAALVGRMLFNYRDRINQLEYEVAKLKKAVEKANNTN